MRHATLRAGLSALALLGLSGCSGNGAPESAAAVSSGNPSTCPGEVLDVVVSIGAWSDVVRRLAGDCATVTTIAPAVDSPTGPAPADRAAFAAADLVVLNGARYDDWAADAVESSGGDPVVVDAAGVAGAPSRARDPHLWYDPAVVPEVAAVVAGELADLSPDAAPYFDAQHTAWTAELQPLLEAVAGLRERVDGRTFAATGVEFGRMADALGLTDATPPAWSRAEQEGRTPTPEDLAAFEAALRDGAVDVLVEVGDDAPEGLRDAADDADVPVVEIGAFPGDGAAFVEWHLGQLGALADALAEER